MDRPQWIYGIYNRLNRPLRFPTIVCERKSYWPSLSSCVPSFISTPCSTLCRVYSTVFPPIATTSYHECLTFSHLLLMLSSLEKTTAAMLSTNKFLPMIGPEHSGHSWCATFCQHCVEHFKSSENAHFHLWESVTHVADDMTILKEDKVWITSHYMAMAHPFILLHKGTSHWYIGSGGSSGL